MVVRVVPVGPVQCGSQSWESAKKEFVTVVVKATFEIDASGAATLATDPDPLTQRDEHYDKNPIRSLREASDFAPYLSRGEIHFRGTAYASAPRTPARLIVGRRNATLVDRSFLIVPPPRETAVPVTSENALGGPGHALNPVGRQDPLLVDARDARIPVLLSPIPRTWRSRASLLRPSDKKNVSQRTIIIDDGFAWDFFHAAPIDLRVQTFFEGDEIVVMENLQPGGERVTWRLPGARAEAIWMRDGEPPLPIALRADTLRIDGDRRRISLTWRGFFPAAAEENVKMVIAAGVAIANQPISWPEIAPSEEDAPAASAAPQPSSRKLDETGVLHHDGLNAPTLPFGSSTDSGPTSKAAGSHSPSIPGAPWASQPAKPVAPAEVGESTVSLSPQHLARGPATPFAKPPSSGSHAAVPAPVVPPRVSPPAAVPPAFVPGGAPPPAFVPGVPAAAPAANFPSASAPAPAPAPIALAPQKSNEVVRLSKGLGSELLIAVIEARRTG